MAKIVAENGGYGDKCLTGNGFKTMVRQGVKTGLVCSLESLAAAVPFGSDGSVEHRKIFIRGH